MNEYNKGSHTVYDIKYHVIWVTKYRYKVLSKPISSRLRELIRQGCEARGYFCATVGSVTEETIKRYIESQELSYKEDIFKIEQ
jgi:putative transposase